MPKNFHDMRSNKKFLSHGAQNRMGPFGQRPKYVKWPSSLKNPTEVTESDGAENAAPKSGRKEDADR